MHFIFKQLVKYIYYINHVNINLIHYCPVKVDK